MKHLSYKNLYNDNLSSFLPFSQNKQRNSTKNATNFNVFLDFTFKVLSLYNKRQYHYESRCEVGYNHKNDFYNMENDFRLIFGVPICLTLWFTLFYLIFLGSLNESVPKDVRKWNVTSCCLPMIMVVCCFLTGPKITILSSI